jgi:uncharacterized membrane protein YeiH
MRDWPYDHQILCSVHGSIMREILCNEAPLLVHAYILIVFVFIPLLQFFLKLTVDEMVRVNRNGRNK